MKIKKLITLLLATSTVTLGLILDVCISSDMYDGIYAMLMLATWYSLIITVSVEPDYIKLHLIAFRDTVFSIIFAQALGVTMYLVSYVLNLKLILFTPLLLVLILFTLYKSAVFSKLINK